MTLDVKVCIREGKGLQHLVKKTNKNKKKTLNTTTTNDDNDDDDEFYHVLPQYNS